MLSIEYINGKLAIGFGICLRSTSLDIRGDLNCLDTLDVLISSLVLPVVSHLQ